MALQASLSIQLADLAQSHIHRVGDAIQPSHPLLSPSPLALNISQHQGLFEIFLLEVSYCQMHRKQNKEVILLTHFQGQTIVTYDAI